MRTPVAILIPHKNRGATLSACVASIRDSLGETPATLVIIDRGSNAATLKRVAAVREAPDVDWMERPGASNAEALNAAIREFPGHHIVRVEPDVVMESSEWLEQFHQLLAARPDVGVVGGRLIFPDGRISSEGRNIVTGVGIDARLVWRSRFNPDNGRGGDVVEVDSVPGALMLIRAEVIEQVGGFDEGYVASCLDDDDLCFAARVHGFKVLADPSLRAAHHTPTFGPTTYQGYFVASELNEIPIRTKWIEECQAQYWTAKWGFDLRHPDLGEVRRLYGATEVAWRVGEAMRFQPRQWPPTVDFVMVTWNNVSVLKRCLESLFATEYPSEQIHLHIADNGSVDGTREYLDDLVTSGRAPFAITVHPLAVNTGVAVGMNWAIKGGGGELVARLDDDVIVPPNWLMPLVEDLRARPFAGVVGPKILNDNVTHTIQCGPFRMFPSIYGHENEVDHGQADYFARVTHVRGCCNLYRRDVLDRCGLFDLRFSPSQYDDPDHHVALGVDGWEVLYDGRVGVIHALNSGAGRTYAALSNQLANNNKLFGKWGTSIWRTLEYAIEYSAEGRFLPDDGDTSEYQQTLEAPSAFPKSDAPQLRPVRLKAIETLHQLVEDALYSDEVLSEYWSNIRRQANSMRRDGAGWRAQSLLQYAHDLMPHQAESLLDLGRLFLELGEPHRAEPLIRRAHRLDPESTTARRLVEQLADVLKSTGVSSLVTGDPGNISAAIGEGSIDHIGVVAPRGMRVLMVNTYEQRVAGGDMHQLNKMATHLRKIGVDVTVSYAPRPDPTGYDIIHPWNLWFPQQTLPQVKGLRVAAPDTPIVMTPIYWDMSEKAWADRVIPGLFAEARNDVELHQLLQDLADDRLKSDGRLRSEAPEPNFPGYRDYQTALLRHIDYLLPNSETEMAHISASLGVRKPYRVIHNGAEGELFDQATPDAFVSKYGIQDFVLTVGLVENRKNQLMLLHALRDCGIPLVVIGRNYDRRYQALCERYAPKDTLFIEHLPHHELASALKAARVFALPSWMECAALASVEAALAGCSLVVSDRTSEREYFGDGALYCDPADIESIQRAVLQAYRSHLTSGYRREQLRNRFMHKFTWENAAQATLEAYEEVLAQGVTSRDSADRVMVHSPPLMATSVR